MQDYLDSARLCQRLAVTIYKISTLHTKIFSKVMTSIFLDITLDLRPIMELGWLVAPTCIPPIVYYGSPTLTVLQLLRRYSPSVAGLPCSVVLKKHLQGHTQTESTCTINNLLKVREPEMLPLHFLFEGGKVFVWYVL